MVLIPTRDPAEAVLAMTLTTPRSAKRRAALKQAAQNYRRTEPKRLTRPIFDPENQPRGQVGRPQEPAPVAVIDIEAKADIDPSPPHFSVMEIATSSVQPETTVSGVGLLVFLLQLKAIVDSPDPFFAEPPSMASVAKEICLRHKIPFSLIRSLQKSKQINAARNEVMYALRARCGRGISEIGKFISRDHSTVSSGSERHAETHGLPRPWKGEPL
ncbi:helix-turn-helix domain-containing protein [Labrenzia sp. DG1229]|uniref:helix-turn-helix domain-containing protein n=1 Tax=Labrenzia sp. DG1229 TaxID=681847 RepID=UPI00048CBC27|nr:helix-turn-helix domain-containing protein [Labrenzia sp. DG1229]